MSGVKVTVNTDVEVDVPLEDIVERMSQLKITSRWNMIAMILKDVETEIDGLTDQQKQVVRKWLRKNLKMFY